MTLAPALAELFRRDLKRLIQELEAFPDDGSLWNTLPGVANSAGNLALHLEGNLREYIGRQLGGVPYHRQRDLEFSQKGVAREELVARAKAVEQLVPQVVGVLASQELEAPYPEDVLGGSMSTGQFLVHLCGHLNYHLGQINYLRRILSQGVSAASAGLG